VIRVRRELRDEPTSSADAEWLVDLVVIAVGRRKAIESVKMEWDY